MPKLSIYFCISLCKINFGLIYKNQGFYSMAVGLDLQDPPPKKMFISQQIQAF